MILRALAAALALAAPVQAAPLSFTDLIVFGDSLSDGGNLGFVATDGLPWSSQLGAAPSVLGGENFAFLTAEASGGPFDFEVQRTLYALSGPSTPGPDPLTVAWFGGNDLLGSDDPQGVADAIEAGVRALADDFGLTRFVIPGLPDLGQIPRFLGTIGAPLATAASDALNAALRGFVASGAASGLELYYADIEAAFEAVTADPAAFGFTNVTGDCDQGTLTECAGFLFWDDIHPTQAGHALIADAILNAQAIPAPVPLPAGAALLLGGLGGLLVLRRRRA